MNIGVDIDGVLANICDWYLTQAKEHFAKLGKTKIDLSHYYTKDIFNVSQEESDKYWDLFIFDYSANVGIIQGASEVMHKLQKDGHKIIINTARWRAGQENEEGERMRNTTIDWLRRYNIPYDEIAFSEGAKYGKNKLGVAKMFNLDIHIDDAENEIKLLCPAIPVIIFDAPYNKNVNPPNTIRAKNWDEVYKIIAKM